MHIGPCLIAILSIFVWEEEGVYCNKQKKEGKKMRIKFEDLGRTWQRETLKKPKQKLNFKVHCILLGT